MSLPELLRVRKDKETLVVELEEQRLTMASLKARITAMEMQHHKLVKVRHVLNHIIRNGDKNDAQASCDVVEGTLLQMFLINVTRYLLKSSPVNLAPRGRGCARAGAGRRRGGEDQAAEGHEPDHDGAGHPGHPAGAAQ